jgi:hypothetical protein
MRSSCAPNPVVAKQPRIHSLKRINRGLIVLLLQYSHLYFDIASELADINNGTSVVTGTGRIESICHSERQNATISLLTQYLP